MYLFMFLMSLCNSNPKNQVESMNEFLDLEKKNGLDGAIGLIKRLIYTGGAIYLNKRHNKAMVHLTSRTYIKTGSKVSKTSAINIL